MGRAEGKAVLTHLAVDHLVDRLQLEPALCGAVSPLLFEANNSDPHLLEVRRLHRKGLAAGILMPGTLHAIRQECTAHIDSKTTLLTILSRQRPVGVSNPPRVCSKLNPLGGFRDKKRNRAGLHESCCLVKGFMG